MNKRQEIYKIIEEKYSIEKENLFDKWLKAGTTYNEKCLKQNILISNLKDLVSYIRLDVSCTSDENFLFWCIQNKFSDYLKHNY